MLTSDEQVKRGVKLTVIWLLLAASLSFGGQTVNQKSSPQENQPEASKDTLGRSTPRGTVLGFLTAARKGNAEIAALYLDTPLRGAEASILARQLSVVLDRRLPPRLNEISDEPEGSVPDPLRPDEDVIGTIITTKGKLDIVLQRVDRGKSGKVWLFSNKTLKSIPAVFQEVRTPAVEEFLPAFLVRTTIATIPLFQLLAFFIGVPLVYLATGLLNRALGLGIGTLRHRLRHEPNKHNPQVLQTPARLLLVAMVIRLSLTNVSLPLLARQFWSTTALLIAIAGCIWWLLLLNGSAERYLVSHRWRQSGSTSVLRLFRRLIDGLVLFAGFLYVLYHFDVNVTAALAGLGVGGIAVALAAQKTLENVIAGVSLIADQAVRVGDFLNLGDVQGTVEAVGLRSTRIRTLDRTLVSLPNGQIANMKLETISVRDRFWFHPVIGLRYETTPAQMSSVLSGIRELLRQNPSIDSTSVRVRFIRIAAFSLEVEVFSYAFAVDWANFLEIQEELLLSIINVVQKAGTAIAFPSQSLYLHDDGITNERSLVRVDHAETPARVG